MAIGSSIELIWHFAGYLHLTQDYVASRVRLDEIIHSNDTAADFRVSADEYLARSEAPSDMSNFAIQVKYSLGSENPDRGEWADLPDDDSLDVGAPNVDLLPHDWSTGTSSLFAGQSYVVSCTAESSGPGGSHLQDSQSHPASTYESKSADGGDDTIANLSQANIGADRDYFSDGPNELGVLPHVASDQPAADMLTLAEEYNPTTMLPPGESVEFWTSAVVDRHESLAAGETEAQTIAPGRYVNGKLVALEPSVETAQPANHTLPEPPVREVGSTDPAQIAETGGNKLVNAATIADLNEAPSTLIVGGDYYETNAILQTNILQNQDVVFHDGDAPPMLDSTGSTLDNVANFVVEELVKQQGHKAGPLGNLTVNIDYVDGHVMDVKALAQRNYFEDGDVTVQTRYDSYSEIHSGDNTQANVARFADWGKDYDVIIVMGDYHSANLILQTNVVLDDDYIGISCGSGGSTPSIFSGQNALENEATIAKYGATTFGGINRKLDSLIDDLNDRDDLDRNAWSDFHGASSGSLNVLFVTGNYYDLNIISQINVLADADFAIQGGSDGWQWLSTGGNSALNQASIVNAGGVYDQHLGGDFYEDSILVQANLMSDGSEAVATDPTALVSELVAFMDHTPDYSDSDSVSWTKDTFGHGDTFGHVLS
ncbi:hypothetical protein [Microvirga brassicacearum]|uniref:Uncharacterized protein n=1 Tax=Microvirga brassicacearum TaxID=2580413 RepID=A0A5N3PD99_9HYPH|nr:hypothetical protein [Microvirga brassicacearum]KAB0267727.1 hypothetical protein FEZ63_10650 [Microvirga brassicacearum]